MQYYIFRHIIICLSVYQSMPNLIYPTLSYPDFTLCVGFYHSGQDKQNFKYQAICTNVHHLILCSFKCVLILRVLLRPQDGAIDQSQTPESPKRDF